MLFVLVVHRCLSRVGYVSGSRPSAREILPLGDSEQVCTLHVGGRLLYTLGQKPEASVELDSLQSSCISV